ncbi:MAG: methylmalonic aciduria and homocystinuria type D protein [Arthrospira sp. SH-MAG29]|nr:methylmalonic aciduria and homocystinuria type D protein [Arthrospira sp. SH-MAG29]
MSHKIKKARSPNISIHPPTAFVAANLRRILPDWNSDDVWIVIFLQRSQLPLTTTNDIIEQEKNRLCDRFLEFAQPVAQQLNSQGWMTDIIYPPTGYPLLSKPGEIHHSDALTVATSLNLPLQKGPCTMVIHPQWGTAVYPSVLISSAPPDEINKTIGFAGYRVAPTHKPHR